MKISKFLLTATMFAAAFFTACDPQETPTPSIKIQATDGSALASLTVPAESSQVTINVLSNVSWSLDNAKPADWITIDKTQAVNETGKQQTTAVTVTFTANTGEARETTLKFSAEGTSLSFNVSQSAPAGSDFDFFATGAVYYGDYVKNGTANWFIQLMDEDFYNSEPKNENGIICVLDCLFTADATFDKGLPTGTINLEESKAAGTFTPDSGVLWYTNGKPTKANPFTAGTVTISAEGATYTITINAETPEGDCNIIYTGELILVNQANENLTQLEDDFVLENIKLIEAYYYGTKYDDPCWETYFVTDTHALMVFFNTDNTTMDQGIPSGTYAIDDTYAPGTIDFGGYEDGYGWGGSLLFELSNTQVPVAPINDGTITVTNNGDGTGTFVIALADDAGNAITGQYEGTVTLKDGEAEAAAPAKARALRHGGSKIVSLK